MEPVEVSIRAWLVYQDDTVSGVVRSAATVLKHPKTDGVIMLPLVPWKWWPSKSGLVKEILIQVEGRPEKIKMPFDMFVVSGESVEVSSSTIVNYDF